MYIIWKMMLSVAISIIYITFVYFYVKVENTYEERLIEHNHYLKCRDYSLGLFIVAIICNQIYSLYPFTL